MHGNVRHLLRLAWVFRLLLSLFVFQRMNVLRRQYFIVGKCCCACFCIVFALSFLTFGCDLAE